MSEYELDENDVIARNQALVDELKDKGYIRSPHIEAAFRTVLRHHFLPGTPLDEVYSDKAIPAKQDEQGQWISSSSQPAIMAIMLEQLGLEPGHNVLEIGAGTGYNAALMAQIVGEAGRVVSVEIEEDLAKTARKHLAMADFEQVQVVCADGGYEYPDAAPFDRIILTVGAPDIIPAWPEQMKPGGRMVLPLMLKGSMKSIAFEPVDDHLASLSVKDCGFIPLRGAFAATTSKRFQLGPDKGLYLENGGQFLIDSDKAYELLTGDSKDWATGVEVVAWEVMMGELWTWLALHEPQMCKLIAEGDMVERNIVPPLLGIDGKQKSAGTAVLFDGTTLVALMRSPEQTAPLVDRDKPFEPGSPFVLPFALFLRQFGPDESTTQRLIAQIQRWNAAGRSSSGSMHIRAYPKDFEYTPSEGEYVLEKQWTKLVVEWPAEVSLQG
jgi:protein-L-isoaspartate(D-aspartate) O-methyltransferase